MCHFSALVRLNLYIKISSIWYQLIHSLISSTLPPCLSHLVYTLDLASVWRVVWCISIPVHWLVSNIDEIKKYRNCLSSAWTTDGFGKKACKFFRILCFRKEISEKKDISSRWYWSFLFALPVNEIEDRSVNNFKSKGSSNKTKQNSTTNWGGTWCRPYVVDYTML